MLVNVLDHLLASFMLEIDVDIRRFAAIRGDEAFEQEAAFARIDIGDAQAITDRRVRRRASALTENVLAAGVTNDVMDGEKVGSVIELRDQRQFMVERLADIVRNSLGIAGGGASPCQVDERVLRRCKTGTHLIGIFVP